MAKSKTIVVTLCAGKTSGGDLYAYAEPDPAVMYVGDTITWKVEAHDGLKKVKPDHFRLKSTMMDSVPFGQKLTRKVTRTGDVSFTGKAPRSGFTRVYKYDIMVGETVVADPDVQIREK
jgi:hypothetical protein